jgi:hypothetical protein
MKIVYIRDVVFIEVGRKSESEVMVKTKNDLEKVWFELRNEEDDSYESTKLYEEVEQPTPIVRRFEQIIKPFERYSPPEFHYVFVLTTTDEKPKLVREEVDSAKGRL